MWRRGFSMGVVVAVATATASGALAGEMDLALERLAANEQCRLGGLSTGPVSYNPAAVRPCVPNHASFAKIATELAAAIAPLPFTSAHTSGYGGIRLGLDATYTTLDSKADYWVRGSRGELRADGTYAATNPSPSLVAQLYSMRLSKGLPFGFELGGAVGFIPLTTIFAGGIDVTFAPFEGLTAGLWSDIPDFAIGVSGRVITGSSQIDLTVISTDLRVSETFAFLDVWTVEPLLAYQWIHSVATSSEVDFTPNTNALNLCGSGDLDTPATGGGTSGAPSCSGSSADFANTSAFDPAISNRHRLVLGGRVGYRLVTMGLVVGFDVVTAEDANGDDSTIDTGQGAKTIKTYGDDPTTPTDDAVGRQWSFALQGAAAF